ncbi:AbrB/MazE/SpoVT family DNA-binding domain-containing protein [Cyanobium sp. ATX 6A2]|uniref:AbrB/MazE/SpoVT family DNA-binding domain-containing protein n=1 Tax=Cyanobium sp. ATX 6A2 TaxID=2823700 RepID=UPI0020CC3423|nr:AbrB/MazE/SpoVT family DNA-binding domain-containing protein [Cyanobium sp. ATX 6A2]
MDLTTVSPKYQVVIPKQVREQFGLAPGQQPQVLALPGRIELVPNQPPAALRGFLMETTPSSANPTACESAKSRGGLVSLDRGVHKRPTA